MAMTEDVSVPEKALADSSNAPAKPEGAAPESTFSFAIKGKKKELAQGMIAAEKMVVEETEMIDAIDDSTGINSLNKKVEAPVVIPLPVRRGKRVQPDQSVEMSAEDKEAEAALIAEATGAGAEDKISDLEVPMLLANRPENWEDLTDETEKYKADMEWRPDAPTTEDYERVKIEDIGTGMLRGMGWEPGAPVGKAGKFARVVEPVEFLKRPSGLGLGASMTVDPKDAKKKKKHIKPGETRDNGPEFFTTQDGKSKRTLDQKLVKRRSTTLEQGSVVTIKQGPHKDLFGTVTSLDATMVQVRLKLNGHTVKLHRDDVRVETDANVVKARMKREREEAGDKAHREKSSKKEKKEKKSKKEKKEKRGAWLLPGIRIRVVDQKFKNGRFYSKKGQVVDVIGNGDAQVMMDGGELVDVNVSLIETALPKEGGAVMVLNGEHKARRGKLLERSSERNHALVQLDNDRSLLKYTLDDVAEWAPLADALDEDEDF